MRQSLPDPSPDERVFAPWRLNLSVPAALCVALHPGTVRTALSSPFSKDGLEVQTPQTSAARLLGVIDDLSPDQSGVFFDHLGIAIPW